MTAPNNRIGERHGKLVVISRAENDAEGNTRWQMRCDCGGTRICDNRRLRKRDVKSCGCARHGANKLFRKLPPVDARTLEETR